MTSVNMVLDIKNRLSRMMGRRTDCTQSDEHVAIVSIVQQRQQFDLQGNHGFTRSMSAPNNGSHGNGPLLSPSADPSDMELLAKLEEANRQLEADRRSLQSLNPSSKSHSRQGSVSSVISNTSVCSNTSNSQLDEITSKPEDLWEIWGKLVSDWENVARRKAQYIKELVRKGIPHHFRGIVWQLLCNAQDCPAKQQYAEYLKMASPCEKMIRRDITRTYPEHNFFKEKDGLGQESLFNVMKAYSIHDREVGYCQGSGFIVGLILMQMPEEEAFAVTVKIMQDYKMRDIFKPSMAELGLCMFQLECMIQEHLPNLYSHFQVHGFYVSMFASSWFLTLFTQTLPIPLACRIFDVFLVEGLEMIFRVGFAILQLTLEDLLARDMEGMITFLQKDMPRIVSSDPERLLATAFQIKFNAKKMKKLEKEYNALKTKEQEEQVELRRLRTENRLLRQRIDNLEKETGTLADRLIQDQVKYAQQEEEVYMLRRDLCVAKQHNQDANQKLDAVTNQLEEIKERSDSQSSSASAEELEDLRTKDEKIEQLEQQLAEVKRQLSESQCTIKELKNKIRELENQNQQLTTEPSKEIEHLQEELIASKLREAEANLALKELQQKVHELEKHWQKYLEQQTLSNVKMTKDKSHQLADDLISMRMKEAEAVAELQENKLKLMELETQNHICSRQIKRQEDEIEKLNKAVEDGKNREKELLNEIKELTRKISNIESKQKEDSMMTKIKDAEHTQTIAEMRRRIAELEIENQELVTAGQLQDRGDRQDLENRLADLQEELLQLKMARRLQSLSSLALNNINLDSETDYDSDDVEATRLRLNDDAVTTDAGRPSGLDLADPDSSDGESPTELAEGATGRQRTARRRRKAALRHGLDLDKTPTQDSVNGAFFGSDQNGRLAAALVDGQADSGRVKALTNGATTCRSRQAEVCAPEDGL